VHVDSEDAIADSVEVSFEVIDVHGKCEFVTELVICIGDISGQVVSTAVW
jgi:hypothetical protein